MTVKVVGMGNGDELMVSLRNRCRHSDKTPLSPPYIAGFKLVRDNILKYRSMITSSISVGALWCQLELAKPGDAYKMTLVACREDEYPFLHPSHDGPHYFYIYRCLFECSILLFC